MGRLAVALMAAIVLALTGVFASLANGSGDITHSVSGTKVNGVGVSGLAVDEVKVRIEGFYTGEHNLAIKERDGRQKTTTGADIDYRMEVPEGLEAILDAQNAIGRVSGSDASNSRIVVMTVTCSQEAMGAEIKALTLIGGFGTTITPDARISSCEEGRPFSVIPVVQGNNVDEARTMEVITATIKAGQSSVDMDSTGCYYQVNIWGTDENLTILRVHMNQYRGMSVNYMFGDEKKTPGGETIVAWVTGSRGGVPMVDLEKTIAFVTGVVSRKDTAETTRIFHIAAGKGVELTGPYGWKIDVAGEIRALATLIQVGPAAGPMDREPVYTMTTASRTIPNWGNTYAEVDLTGQHVYMFQEGNLVWDAPCITGNISKDYDTPAGIYSLTHREKDRTLRGTKKADGTYEYGSHVDYWILLNGSIGFHDATWRSKLGGIIFQTDGGHGCISPLPEKASALYDSTYKGMPVLCYQ